MAATSIPVKYIDEITDCPICYEVYTDPRVLPCIHTFCLKCITSWGKDKLQGDELACPLCRKVVKVPTGGLGELPKNLFVDRLLEVRKISTSMSTINKLCDVCCDDSRKSEDDKRIAKHCTECQQNMCQQCAEYHQKVRLTKSHKLIDVGKEGVATEMLLKVDESFCDKHDDKRLELYCMECKLAVCIMCFVESHQTHKCGNIKSVAEELSKQVKDDVRSVAGKVGECSEMLVKIGKVGKKYEQSVGSSEQEICKRANDLKQLIDECKDSLLQELRTEKKAQDKKIETMRDELNGQMMMMESFRKYSEELLNKGTACDVVRAASDLNQRAREFMSFNVNELVDIDEVNAEVKFAFRNILAGDIDNLFGELHIDCNDTIVFPDSVKSIHVLPTNGESIGGVTSLGDEVFVVRNNTQQVEVYDVNTMSQKHTIQVAGLGDVWCGLAACNVNKCLYIADNTNNVVHRVELVGSCRCCAVSKWSVCKGPDGLSVNANCNILIAGFGSHKIEEYTTRGTLIRAINLYPAIGNPTFVTQLSHDLFGVTHAGTNHGYSVVSADGRVVKSYDNSSGSGPGQMNWPYGIAINKRGFVFIADQNNNRIVVLNPETFSCRELSVSVDGGLNRPMCLCLDESRDRLYIGECVGGRAIVVYKVNNLKF